MITLGISARELSPSATATFAALGQAFGVSFEMRACGDDRGLAAWIVLGADRRSIGEITAGANRPCYVVPADAELIACGPSSRITFADRQEVAPLLRSREITAEDAAGIKALPGWLPGVAPIAFKDGRAVWGVQARAGGGVAHYYVAALPPELRDDEPLFAHFSGQRMARLLPLVLFLQSLTFDPSWEQPPLQAAFMFDDPNLHAASYGFIDYREMVRHASAGNYHVSFATIPLDAWFVRTPARALFLRNPRRISLLYHGNDHVSNELASSISPESVERLLDQALARVARMEHRTGLEVAKVMAPPHGACNETALAGMAALGFEAVCVSRGSLRFHNPTAAWTRTIGMHPCDTVAGLSAVPRFGLSRQCSNDIVIAALLRQPIVPMTHHQAVADGYDLLDSTASSVNSLGEVAWRDMKTISRSLYSHKLEGSTFRVKMWTRRVSVQVPLGTARLRIEAAKPDGLQQTPLLWRPTSGEGPWIAAMSAEDIAVPAGEVVEVVSDPAMLRPRKSRNVGSRRLAPVARRFLTEVRDRGLPSVRRVARMGQSIRRA